MSRRPAGRFTSVGRPTAAKARGRRRLTTWPEALPDERRGRWPGKSSTQRHSIPKGSPWQ